VLTPISETTRETWSVGSLRRAAEMTPSGIEVTSAKVKLESNNSSVTGSRSMIFWVTGTR